MLCNTSLIFLLHVFLLSSPMSRKVRQCHIVSRLDSFRRRMLARLSAAGVSTCIALTTKQSGMRLQRRAVGCSRSQHRRASHLSSSFRLRSELRDAVTRLRVALVFRTHKNQTRGGWLGHTRLRSQLCCDAPAGHIISETLRHGSRQDGGGGKVSCCCCRSDATFSNPREK